MLSLSKWCSGKPPPGGQRLPFPRPRRSEVQEQVKWLFSEWDRNEDGLVSREEFMDCLTTLCGSVELGMGVHWEQKLKDEIWNHMWNHMASI